MLVEPSRQRLPSIIQLRRMQDQPMWFTAAIRCIVTAAQALNDLSGRRGASARTKAPSTLTGLVLRVPCTRRTLRKVSFVNFTHVFNHLVFARKAILTLSMAVSIRTVDSLKSVSVVLDVGMSLEVCTSCKPDIAIAARLIKTVIFAWSSLIR